MKYDSKEKQLIFCLSIIVHKQRYVDVRSFEAIHHKTTKMNWRDENKNLEAQSVDFNLSP